MNKFASKNQNELIEILIKGGEIEKVRGGFKRNGSVRKYAFLLLRENEIHLFKRRKIRGSVIIDNFEQKYIVEYRNRVQRRRIFDEAKINFKIFTATIIPKWD